LLLSEFDWISIPCCKTDTRILWV